MPSIFSFGSGGMGAGTGGTPVYFAANYAALPAPGTVPDTFYWVHASQGTKFIGVLWGGTYYPAGLYYSDGVSWEYQDTPSQATQSEVNTGTVTNKWVSPDTLANTTQVVHQTGNETVAGVKTFTSDPIVPDEAYDATAWNGSMEPPTKNAVRDKLESMGGGGITVASTVISGGTDTYVGFNNAGVYGESSLLQVITSISRVVAAGTLIQGGDIYAYKHYSRNAPNYIDMDGGATVFHTDGGSAHANFLDSGFYFGDAAYASRDASSVLQIDSTTKGFTPPRMTTTQRDNIVSPMNGLIIYNTTDGKHQGYNGSWNNFY